MLSPFASTTGDSIVEHVAGVDDFEVAEVTYRAAVARWPTARITLRQGARVVHIAERPKHEWPLSIAMHGTEPTPRPAILGP
jgi:hypothetical protein